jgi:hypothetical protein
VERRKSVPGFDAKSYHPGFADKLCFATLDAAGKRLKDARALPHPYLGYALRPDWNSSPTDPQQCHHNSLGFRGKETTYEKPAGVFRIVTVGGSSVYGQSESRDGAVWSQRLEDILNDAHPARRIEVINEADGAREDLIQDFVSVITSFCARLYGQRRAKRKTEKLIAELRAVESAHRDGDGA